MVRPPRQSDWLAAAEKAVLGDVERWADSHGYSRILGLDEAGRGPLAGPVVAAAVCLPPVIDLPGLDDSKKLTPKIRERLFPAILNQALAWGAAFGSPQQIDRDNILAASLDSMRRAALLAETRGGLCDIWIVDGNRALPSDRLQRTVVGGDRLCLAVAAASVIAKVLRDRWMVLADRRWPGYGFAVHKGYPTAAHRRAVAERGPCPIHRRSFRGVSEYCPENAGD